MKTKVSVAILILTLVFLLSLLMSGQTSGQTPEPTRDGQEEEQTKQHSEARRQNPPVEADTEDPYEDGEYTDESSIFSRKVYERPLEPLTRKEQITWAFILSEPNTFL
ncbi:MAG: hypothetical protein GY765_05310 [bacterium]|nr:hypothetical protein [bacterium]